MVRNTPPPTPEMVTDSIFARLEARFEQLNLERSHIQNMAEAQIKKQEELKLEESKNSKIAGAQAKQHEKLKALQETITCKQQELVDREISTRQQEDDIALARHDLADEDRKLEKEKACFGELVATAQSREERLSLALTDVAEREKTLIGRQDDIVDRETRVQSRELALSLEEGHLRERNQALDENTETVSARLHDVEIREFSMQCRESDLAAEEDRLERLRNEVESAATSTGAAQDPEVQTAEDDYRLKFGRRRPSEWNQLDKNTGNGDHGEIYACRPVSITNFDDQHYTCQLEFADPGAEFEGFMLVPKVDFQENSKPLFLKHGLLNFRDRITGCQAILRQLIPEKCTDDSYTRRILVQMSGHEWEGECTMWWPEEDEEDENDSTWG